MSKEKDLQLSDNLHRLAERTRLLIDVLGLKVDVVERNEHWYDPCIELGSSGIGVTIFWGTRKSIAGEIEEIQFGAYKTVPISGTHWDPPDADVIDLGKASSSLDGAIMEAIREYVSFVITEIIQAEDDNALAEELHG